MLYTLEELHKIVQNFSLPVFPNINSSLFEEKWNTFLHGNRWYEEIKTFVFTASWWDVLLYLQEDNGGILDLHPQGALEG